MLYGGRCLTDADVPHGPVIIAGLRGSATRTIASGELLERLLERRVDLVRDNSIDEGKARRSF